LLHRYGSVAVQLATRLLAMRPGDRIDSIGQLAADFQTGRGTVQTALRLLTKEGAVELETRGSLGSYIRSLDQDRLLTVSGLSPIIGVMAVTYSRRFQGLAAGLTRAFEQAKLPLVLAHLRGGKNRLHFLRTGRCDFAVISRLAWQEEQGVGDLELRLSFGPGSNVGDHVLVLASPQAKGIVDGMKVGVDPSSSDHMHLTLEECRGKAVRLVEISYAQALPKLQAGEIDATVWDSGVPLPASLGLAIAPRERRDPSGDPDTEAVLVTRSQAGPLGDLIHRRVEPGLVAEVQRRVLAGEEFPIF